MGSGKTAVGRRAAARLSLRFVDMDAEIERQAGRKISDIFATEGEAHFRSLERSKIKELARQPDQVIATGGGIVLDEDNLNDLRKNGVVICLWVDVESAFQRTRRATDRPLLDSPDRRKKIEELLQKRLPLYGRIENVVDTRERSLESVVEDVIRIYRGSQERR